MCTVRITYAHTQQIEFTIRWVPIFILWIRNAQHAEFDYSWVVLLMRPSTQSLRWRELEIYTKSPFNNNNTSAVRRYNIIPRTSVWRDNLSSRPSGECDGIRTTISLRNVYIIIPCGRRYRYIHIFNNISNAMMIRSASSYDIIIIIIIIIILLSDEIIISTDVCAKSSPTIANSFALEYC